LFEAGHLQFITTSTYRRVRVFSHPDYCALFVNAVREARAKFRFLLIGWVLLQPWPAESTSDLVKDIKQRSANFILKALQATCDVGSSPSLLRSFHLPPRVHNQAHYRVWQRRFVPFNVYTEKKCREELEYMHNNPVKRRLVTAPGDWPWSSWRFYYSGDVSLLEMDRWEDSRAARIEGRDAEWVRETLSQT
jgi:putative transposase